MTIMELLGKGKLSTLSINGSWTLCWIVLVSLNHGNGWGNSWQNGSTWLTPCIYCCVGPPNLKLFRVPHFAVIPLHCMFSYFLLYGIL
jgi:hypothetical protein